MSVLSDREITPDPESITTFPVDEPPRVRVFIRRLWIVELFASRDKPFSVDPAIVAIGASSLIPVIANCAEVVD